MQVKVPDPNPEHKGDTDHAPDMRVLRVFRLMRIFKLGRHSSDLNFIFSGLAQARVAFMLLGFLMFLALIFFSFLLYTFEKGTWDEKLECYKRLDEVHYTGCSPFQSVPMAFWWGITTLTTVGYGDAFPLTAQGRFIAGFCMLCGLL